VSEGGVPPDITAATGIPFIGKLVRNSGPRGWFIGSVQAM
jgi:hypothetical protein